MLQRLFKPKWQSKKPAIRLKALVTLEGYSDALILLAETDPDSEVRLHAVQKLQHIPTLAKIAAKTDGVIPRAAKQRITTLAITPNIDEQALEQAYVFIDDYQVHCHAVRDPHKTLTVRKCALQYIEDQNLLFELAKTDKSKDIQFLAAQRLNNYQQLKQLEKLTKTNKRLRKLLKDKAQIYQEKQATLHLLDQLCTELESLGSGQQWKHDKTHCLIIQQKWKNIQGTVTDELQQRYQQALDNFRAKQQQHQQYEAELQPLREYYYAILATLDTLHTQSLTFDQLPHQAEQINIALQHSQQQWNNPAFNQTLPEQELQALQQRYQVIQQQLNQYLQQIQKQQQTITQFQVQLKQADKMLQHKSVNPTQLMQLQKQWQQIKIPIGLDIEPLQYRYTQLIQRLKNKLQVQQQQVEKNIQQMQHWLTQMENQIEADQLSKAIQLYKKINQLLSHTHNIPAAQFQAIKQRVQTATPIIKSAQSWRHWGTDQAREQLVTAAESLSKAQDITPLERAKQLKKLRNEWKKLGQIDPQKHQKQWERFDALCTKAYQPCQAFYQQESQQRGENLKQRQKICTALQQLEQDTDWHHVDWRNINKIIQQHLKQWKQAGAVDGSDWKIINLQFNQAMEALETHLANERRINWNKRETLVRQAENLLLELQQSDDVAASLPNLMQAAKQLQAQWQPTITSHRAEEQKLWNQFRLAIDAIFTCQREQHDASQQTLQQNLQQKQAIIKELTTISDTNTNLSTIQTQLNQLEQDFNAITELPRGRAAQTIQTDFNTVKARLQKYIIIQQQQQQFIQLSLLADKVALCRIADKNTATQTTWQALDSLDNKKLEQQLQTHFNQTTENYKPVSLQQLFTLILDIEILLELPSPADYQAERMQRQIERLSEQMQSISDTTQAKQDLAINKIIKYYLLLSHDTDNQALTEPRFAQIATWIKTSLKI